MSFASKLITLGAFASTALAHGTVTGFVTDGTYNGGFKLDYYYMKVNGQTPPATAGWYAENLDNGFVEPNSYGAADIICHKNAVAATSTASVKAGGTVDFQWSAWPESHIGPVITYIAPCNGDCSAVDKSTLKFTKIAADGYDVATKTWAAVAMIANNNTASVTVPSSIKAGNYVFRHEIIALHGAGSENGAQNYPQCVNIEITGSGTEEPAGVLGTELYTTTEAGILFNPYTTITSYEIPGPALFGAGTETTPTPVATSTTVPTATAAPPAPTATGTPSTTLPETFTLDTFISWLKEVGGAPASKARRHARAF
ncbi:lytic polysaccharide monooxygenase [Melanomma pulvis-pyrius CBS 109.77]|uniref:Lytic polysaccharide monooxygenase n=1 Tax=Melanomma pulvis-pyrius CBS 109.77 TaxID=1314802 RepID=A0A6A6X7Z6_9PLEO|nr:lytic polysaccharide monooxygenase [Melanomma pulvis-pyrius CBS 109.77]